MTNHDEQMKAVARLVSGRPDWIDAPAVQAWHRSDGRTEHDGTPGKPRIWSPDYRTTERWSTPSLQNVHWSDLVDVVPLAAPAGSYTRTDEADWKARAEKAEQERDEARADLAEYVLAQSLRTQPRPLTPDAITDEMRRRAREAFFNEWDRDDSTLASGVNAALTAALTEPPARPEGAEEIEAELIAFEETEQAHTMQARADFLAERGVRVIGGEDPR